MKSGLLQLDEPAAVLVYRFTVYSKDDQPIQTDDATYPPDHWAFRQEYPLTLTKSASRRDISGICHYRGKWHLPS